MIDFILAGAAMSVVLIGAVRIISFVRRPHEVSMTLAQQETQLETGLLPDWVTSRLDAWLSRSTPGSAPADSNEDLDGDDLWDDDGERCVEATVEA